MAKLQINPQGTEEIFELYLDPVKHPVAYNNKVEELVGSGMSREEADSFIQTTPFVLEAYYSTGQGLFLVESEAIEFNDIHNPYDGTTVYNPEKNIS
jgi:hypothetical protein